MYGYLPESGLSRRVLVPTEGRLPEVVKSHPARRLFDEHIFFRRALVAFECNSGGRSRWPAPANMSWRDLWRSIGPRSRCPGTAAFPEQIIAGDVAARDREHSAQVHDRGAAGVGLLYAAMYQGITLSI